MITLNRQDRPDTAAMVDTAIIFALGFLAAALLSLLLIPLVQRRAERLTAQRIEESIPMDVAEMHARKDHLRAEFALSTRRFEGKIEELTAKLAGQLADLGRKDAVINRQKLDLEAKAATIATLTTRGTPFHRAGEDESSIEERFRQEFAKTLANKEAAITKLKADLEQRTGTVNTQRVEIATMEIRINALMDRVADLMKSQSQEPSEPEQRPPPLRLVR